MPDTALSNRSRVSTDVKAWNDLSPLSANSPGEQRRRKGLTAAPVIWGSGPEPAVVPELRLGSRDGFKIVLALKKEAN